ncbi:MAG: glycosyltransferase family 4 protein [Kiritimatiellia bacterium]|jgi:phosphatidylinositol alpha-1,6-mannosyltransferase
MALKKNKIKFFLAAESLHPGNGGICRVARLMMRALGEWTAENGGSVRGVVLSDDTPPPDAPFPIRACAGSRLKFAAATHTVALTCNRFVYDFLGMARAHCRIPFLKHPFMTFICGIEIWENARADRLLWSRRADTLVSISEYTRNRADSLHGGFAGARLCWLGTEADELPVKLETAPHPPRVMILARMSRAEDYKGHRELIAAWPEVAAAVPGAMLTIAGGGDALDDYRRLAAASPVANQIEFLGFVPEQEIDALWAQTDVFAMPSRNEGFGLVYIEAMRHSLPVIASVHDAGGEINVDGLTGWNVNLNHPGELPDRIIRLLKNLDERRQMGVAGCERWQEHFRYTRFRERFFGILNDFAATPRQHGGG